MCGVHCCMNCVLRVYALCVACCVPCEPCVPCVLCGVLCALAGWCVCVCVCVACRSFFLQALRRRYSGLLRLTSCSYFQLLQPTTKCSN